jgi:hypothetical protein
LCKVFALSLETLKACDRKVAAKRFCFNNHRDRFNHFFDTFEDQIESSNCVRHDGLCQPSAKDVECFVSGLPCQAWSRMRFANKSKCPASSHPGWETTFNRFAEYIKHARVHGGIFEQVGGFADASPDLVDALHGFSSPLE